MQKRSRAGITMRSLDVPSGAVEYSLIPPHEQADFVTTTRSGTVGVSFSGHRKAVREFLKGPVAEGDIPPGSCFLTMSKDLVWLRIQEPTEALEIDLDEVLVRSVAEEIGASQPVSLPDIGPRSDLVIWAAGAVFRRAVLSHGAMEELEAASRLRLLTRHILSHYGGLRLRSRAERPLDQRRLQRIEEAVRAKLSGSLTLEQLAEVAALSPFHFLRSFRRTTGMTPHAYVTAQRMDEAMRLFTHSSLTVAEVARQVGYANLSHFRRMFLAHWGAYPSRPRLSGSTAPPSM